MLFPSRSPAVRVRLSLSSLCCRHRAFAGGTYEFRRKGPMGTEPERGS